MLTLTIESSRFGKLEIASEDVIEFPDGLIGLGGRRYAIVTPKAEGAFSWLHSIDDPSLALPVANPWHFFARLHGRAVRPGVRADHGRPGGHRRVGDGPRRHRARRLLREPAGADPRQPTAPGHQVINESAAAPVRAPLFPALAAAVA